MISTNKLTGDYTGTGWIGSIRRFFNMSSFDTFGSGGVIEEIGETARINHAQKLYDYYTGDVTAITKHVEKALGKTFSAEDIGEMQFLYLPVTKRLIDKLCVIYKTGVWRTLSTDDRTKQLNDLLDMSDVNQKQRHWYRMAKLFHTVLVKPTVREYEGKKFLNFDVFTPNKCIVIEDEDNFLLPRIVVYEEQTRDADGKATLRTVYWSADEHFVVDSNGEKIIDEGNPSGRNPYGFIPFVVLRLKETENFWGEGESILVNAEEKINILLAQMMELLIMQTHGQPVFSNARIDGDIKTGPKHPVILNPYDPSQPASFSFVSPDGKIDEVQRSIDWIITRLATMYGMSRSSESGESQMASGYAKLLDNWDLLEQRQEDIEILRDFERRLFEKVVMICNYEGMSSIPENEILNIEFEEYEYPENPVDDLKAKQQKLELGLWSPVDDLMEADKTLTRTTAMEILRQNLAERDELKDMFGAFRNLNGQINNNGEPIEGVGNAE